jgi:hypothetical protein
MPRNKKSKPVPSLPGDFDPWFTHKKATALSSRPRRGPVPPELQEARFIEPENLDRKPSPPSSRRFADCHPAPHTSPQSAP